MAESSQEIIRLRGHHIRNLLTDAIVSFTSEPIPDIIWNPEDDLWLEDGELVYSEEEPGRTRDEVSLERGRLNPKILVVAGLDGVCQNCPNRDNPLCQPKSGDLDERILKRFGLEIGAIYSLGEIFRKLQVNEIVAKMYFISDNRNR